jgi:type III secretion protein L
MAPVIKPGGRRPNEQGESSVRGESSLRGDPVRADRADPAPALEAKRLVEEAERKAIDLLEATRQEAADLVRAAVSAGEKEGFSQAETMREEIVGLEARMLREVDGEILRAALRTAQELLETELEQRDDAIVDIACAALVSARDAREIIIRAHPRHAAVLRRQSDRLLSMLARAREIEVREDRKAKPGGVLIQTESGVVDAQMQTQLEEIARVLGA